MGRSRDNNMIDENYRKNFGERVKRCRLNLGYSQVEFAELLGICSSYVCHIENGTRQPTLDVMLSLSKCVDVSLDYLVTGTGEQAQSSFDAINADLLNRLNKLLAKENSGALRKLLTILVDNYEKY